MKILSLYPDEDREEWKKHLHEFPETWINGYDRNLALKSKNLYDLKAIPTLYLLEREKRILLKDVTVRQINRYLQ